MQKPPRDSLGKINARVDTELVNFCSDFFRLTHNFVVRLDTLRVSISQLPYQVLLDWLV